MTFHKTFLCTSALFVFAGAAQAADIRIGVPNWAGAEGIAYLMDKLVEQETGLEVDHVSSTNPVIFKAMNDGELDAHPDVWLPNQENLANEYVKEKGTVKFSPNYYDGFGGFCVTQKTADDLGIKSIYDLANPDIATQFPADGTGKPDIWVGASGWAGTSIDTVRLTTYGVSETFNIIEMDETLAMARIKDAAKNDTYLATLCFAPNLMFELADLVRLEEPAYDKSKWTMVQPTEDPDWLEKSHIEVAYPPIRIQIAYATSLEQRHPRAAEIFRSIQLDTDTLVSWNYQIVEIGRPVEDVIDAWMDMNQDRINSWLGL